MDMPVRSLGHSDFAVSAIGLGCMGMSEFYGPSEEARSLATLERALELGIALLDTADMYGHGKNETLIGRFLRGRHERVVLATKFGILRTDDPDARPVDGSPSYVRAACEASLQRLGVETIDLYYMHRRDAGVPIEDTVGAMAGLVAEGKVRALGLCEVGPDTIRRAHAVHPIAAIQSEWSLWAREPEAAVWPLCRELDIAFVPYSPLGRGALTGTLDPDALAPNDFRRAIPRLRGEALAANLSTLDALRVVAARHDATPGQVALAWLLAQGAQVVPIPGTRRPERAEENAGAASLALTDEDLAALHAAFPPGVVKGSRLTPAGEALVDL